MECGGGQYNKGIALESLGRSQEALAAFEQAIYLNLTMLLLMIYQPLNSHLFQGYFKIAASEENREKRSQVHHTCSLDS